MADTWFTSDFHLGHFNIIRYCNRPFADTQEMNEAIVERMNASVKPNDVLYFLGDFCMGGPKAVALYRNQDCQQDDPLHRRKSRQYDSKGTAPVHLLEFSLRNSGG